MKELAALLAICAPDIGSETMEAIIKAESGGRIFSIGDNTTGKSIQPEWKEEAVAIAETLLSKGHSLDLGLAQINSSNLKALGLTLEEIFDPCTNIRAGSEVLKWSYQRAVKKHGQGQKALLSAISAYNTGSLEKGFMNGYVNKVVGQTKSANVTQLAVPNPETHGKNTKNLKLNSTDKMESEIQLRDLVEAPSKNATDKSSGTATEKVPDPAYVRPENSPLEVTIK